MIFGPDFIPVLVTLCVNISLLAALLLVSCILILTELKNAFQKRSTKTLPVRE